MKTNPLIVLTGGPGGGKTCLLERLQHSRRFRGSVAVLEEAIHGMRFVRMSPRSAEFRCALVAVQAATLDRLLGELWRRHPNYVRREGTPGIEEKLSAACALIEEALSTENAIFHKDHR